MCLSLFPTPVMPEPLPVPVSLDLAIAERRLEDLAIGAARYLYRQPVKRIAADMDLSTRTVKRRAAAALKYDGPMAERLRRLAGRNVAGAG